MLDSSKINLHNAKILIADDNENARNIIQDMLQAFGAREIVAVNDGVEAKAALAKQPFDLLITDGSMPECDGYELVRWLRNRPSDQERITPAIIVSAHVRESQVAAGRDCGANYIIAKPVSPQTLLERIFYITKDPRPFVIGDTYAGPDRRWKHQGPPGATEGRRKDDLPAEVGAIAGANLSENELDSLITPQRVTP